MHLYRALTDMHSMALYNNTYIYIARRADIYNQGPTVNVTANLQYFNAAIYMRWTPKVTRPSV